MTCTFCGSGNRPENRFCGMCGVRLERRQKERRTTQSGSLKCSACNCVNEAGYKFCGMCGTRVERRVQERRGSTVPGRSPASNSPGRAVAQANAQLPSPELATVSADLPRAARAGSPAPAVLNQMERAEPAAVFRSHERSGSISGPSFLGLSSEPQGEGGYLLEDESSSHNGLRKLVLLVVLLAIVGLIFVQWRTSYQANPKPLEPPKPEPATVPRPQGKNQPPQGNIQKNQNAKDNLPAVIDEKQAQETRTAGSKDAGTTTPAQQKGDGQARLEEKQGVRGRTRAEATAAEDSEDQDSNDEGQRQPTHLQKVRDAAVSRERPSVALVKAQRYLQGRGVPQNCEQGMMYLKAATQQNDPNAAVQMAALYASGHCVRQDRAKAYEWFASANNLEPGNQWIAKNMNQLWGEMTPQERRQFQ